MNIRPLRWIAAASIALFAVQPVVAQATPTVAPIIGGTTTAITAVPWQVGILGGTGDAFQNQFCGGSIMNAEWVITAAHCVVDEFGSPIEPPLWVFAGAASLDDTSGANEYEVDGVYVHPDYVGGDSDIALLHVAQPLPLNGTTMKAIALPIHQDPDFWPMRGTDVVVSGWGNISTTDTDYPTDLYKTTLDVISGPLTAGCENYGTDGWNYITELCVGVPTTGGRDTCQGDSGGPYAIKDGNTWTLAGVTSWGDGCAVAGSPGIASRVTTFVDWLVPDLTSATLTNNGDTGDNSNRNSYDFSWEYATGSAVSDPAAARLEYSTDGGTSWELFNTSTNELLGNGLNGYGPANAIFRIAAVNELNIDNGPYRWTVLGDYTVPSAPQSAAATVSGTTATITWSAPADSGNLPSTGYIVTANPGGATCATTNRTCTIAGLPLGVAHTFSVVATNVQGWSTRSGSSNAVTARTVPSAPRFLQVRSATSRSVWLQWSVPASTGGATVTDYRVYYKTATGAWRRVTGDPVSTSRSYTFTRPSRAKLWFKVVAVNSVGVSVASTTVSTPAR